MRDLVDFLRARLDDDERKARAASPGPWRHDPGKHWRKPGTVWFEEAIFAGPPGGDATCIAGTGETDDPQSMSDAEHIARHDPARVVADVEAKRRLIKRYENALAATASASTFIRGQDDGYRQACLDAIRDAAEDYAAHPEHDEGWRP